MSEKELTPEDKADAARLKKIVERSGMTQEQVGAELGLTQGMIAHYLNGRRKIHLDAAIDLSNLFKVPVSEFSPTSQARINSAYNSPAGGNLVEVISMLKGIDRDDLAMVGDLLRTVINRKSSKQD